MRAAREIHANREELEANQAALDEAREKLEANQAALDENLIARAALRASTTRLHHALACALVALLVDIVATIVFKR